MTRSAAVPPAVPRFEYNLLRLLRFLVGQVPPDQARPLLTAKLPTPPCLSATCVRLAQDTLAKGLVMHLVSAGGWRRERFLRAGEPIAGRVWDRIPLPERTLEFGPAVLEFLVWLTANHPGESPVVWNAPANLAPADELFFAVAFDHLRGVPELVPHLAGKPAFRGNGLCWLLATAEFAGGTPTPPDFVPWTSGPRAAFLECFQPVLAERWLRSERTKGQIADWLRMRDLGGAEYAALSAFLTATHAAARPDLARFVLHATSTVLASPDLSPDAWTGGLKDRRPGRLADRLETTRAALAVVRQVETLRNWERQARTVGYFDEGYAASQAWKADWEAARGDEIANRAHAILEQIEPLHPGERGA